MLHFKTCEETLQTILGWKNILDIVNNVTSHKKIMRKQYELSFSSIFYVRDQTNWRLFGF